MSTVILAAFFSRLETFTYSPTPAIAWPNIKFDPPSDGLWLEVDYFPIEGLDIAWGNDACQLSRGFFQIGVGFRSDAGILAASALSDAIIEHFPKGLLIGSVEVNKKPWTRSAITDRHDSSQSFIPVTISYRGLTK